MQETPYLLGFTAGELSPWLSCRFDLQAYQRGAALIRNFLVQPYGGLSRRMGTMYVGNAASQSDAIRLFPFRFSESDVLMLEFYPGAVRFYKDGALLKSGSNTYTVAGPWSTAAAVNSLQFAQINDVVYITSPTAPPVMLQRYSNTNWELRTLDFKPFPRETYALRSKPLSVRVFADSTFSAEAEEDVFSADMVDHEYLLVDTEVPSKTLFLNTAFEISSTAMPNLQTQNANIHAIHHEVNATTGYYEFYTCYRAYDKQNYMGKKSASFYRNYFFPGAMILNDGNPYEVCGDWEVRTNGEWDASWEIWRSYDTFSDNMDFRCWQWSCIKTFDQSSFSTRNNWVLTGSETMPCRMVIVCRSSKTLTINSMMYMVIRAGIRDYKMLITGYTSARKVTGRCLSFYINPVSNFLTYSWSFGAFGPRNGYPKLIAFHQGRLWLGGIAGIPTTLLASTVGDFYNFRMGSGDDAALSLTLATTDQSRICWICPARSLLVGTTESEWVLAASDGGAIKATNASFSRQSSVGSEDKPASGVENTVFYVQRGGARLREISYKLEADGFTSTDVSLLAQHLFTAGVREWAVQRGGCTRLWVLMNDGSLAVLTLNMEQQISAWQRVALPGRKVLRVATLPKSGGNEDEVWLVLRNTTGGCYSIERIGAGSGYLDGFKSGTVGSAPHLAGLAGMAYPQGHPEQAVPVQFSSTGAFSVSGATGTWCFGATYDSELQTMPLERDFSFNTTRQEGRVRLRILESNPTFHYRSSHIGNWEEYDPARDCLPATYTGSIRVSHIPAPVVGQGFSLKVDGLHGFHLLALTVEFDYHGH